MLVYYTPRKRAFVPFDSTPPGGEPEPVVIVGAGPVGLALALGLAQRGVPVTVLEADETVCHGSRAICLSRHSLEVLERLGLGTEFADRSLPWTAGRSYYRDTEVLAFEMPHSDADVRAPMVNISQSVAEQVLADAVERHPNCALRWRSRVAGCEQRDEFVRTWVDTPDGRRQLDARWLIATDGARSAVRESLGLRLSGTSYEGRYVIADIHWRSPLPAERKVWFDPPSNPGSTLILHRQPDDIWRVDYQLRPDEDSDEAVREDRVRERITRHLDWLGNSEPWTLEWSSIYRAHSLSLASYAHGNVLFAGDAAHLVPIFGVRGLNSGLEDAEVLSWMLASVVRGSATADLLDTYSAERRAAWEQNVAQAELSTLFMTPGTTGYELTRDAVLALATRRPVLRNLINPRQSSATHSRGSTLTLPAGDGCPPQLNPGDPVPDSSVLIDASHGAPRQSGLHAERGPDFTVLGVDTDPDRFAEFARAMQDDLGPAVGVRALLARTRGAPARVCGAVTSIDDTTGTLAHSLAATAGEVFVVRPDGLLLARAPELDDLGSPDALAKHVLQGGIPR